MSYQVIARKWRPQNFDQVTGQEHVTTPLRNAIRTGRFPHALLLAGPRGTGKTTLARIIARCLNCDAGPTETPCGECSSCREIVSGRSTDVQEIDAASRTGVDDMRELNEAIRYAPTPGKHRIFVIDEVHMLSKNAFNALLKTLEEPPPNSLFVFATTNPEKLPFTVLSRCQRYDLRLFGTSAVAERLGEICQAEGVKASEASLRILAREGHGSMRDSQTLLDQVIAYGDGEITDDALTTMLDLVDRRLLLEILGACVDGDPGAALVGCQRALQSGAEAGRLAESLGQMLRDAVVLALAPKAESLVEGSEGELEELRALAQRAGAQTLRRMFKILIKEQEDFAWVPQPFAALEMAVVRLATLPSGEDVAELVEQLKQLERKLARGGAGGGGGVQAAPITKTTPPAKAPRPGASAAPIPSEPAPPRESPIAEPAAPSPKTAPASPPPQAEVEPGAPLGVVMDRLKAFAQKEDRALFSSLDAARLLDRSEGSLRIAIPNAFHRKRIEGQIETLQGTVERFFGKRLTVEIVAGQTETKSATAPPSVGEKRERDRRQRNAALNHPAINMGLEELRGEIVEIRPLGSD
ncbi:MAG: DNA polymerase III subunit gamma/tau [Myxococcota bacterium]|nr:DNA polymerase III subunit gamma/tau [Myxococcota bacterium]